MGEAHGMSSALKISKRLFNSSGTPDMHGQG